MQQITIAGVIAEDSEKKTNEQGHEYVRFKVHCTDTDNKGKQRITVYRCYTYKTQFDNLKKGECIFLTGTLIVNTAPGKVALDIFAQQLARGNGQN